MVIVSRNWLVIDSVATPRIISKEVGVGGGP